MARVVVDVMPKPEILDPQGKAVTGALGRLGFAGVSVRQGPRRSLDQLAGPSHQGVVARLAVREYLDEDEALARSVRANVESVLGPRGEWSAATCRADSRRPSHRSTPTPMPIRTPIRTGARRVRSAHSRSGSSRNGRTARAVLRKYGYEVPQ